MVIINWPGSILGVFLSAIASMILGMLWYGPIFGKLWMRLSGMKITDKQIQEAKKKGMGAHYFAAFIGNIVMAFALSSIMGALGVTNIGGAWALAMIIWIGFVLTTTLSGVLWEGKRLALYSLNNLYGLINLLMISAILTYL